MYRRLGERLDTKIPGDINLRILGIHVFGPRRRLYSLGSFCCGVTLVLSFLFPHIHTTVDMQIQWEKFKRGTL